MSEDITVTLRAIDRASPILEIIARRFRMMAWRKGLGHPVRTPRIIRAR
jgi:hypothetical protein